MSEPPNGGTTAWRLTQVEKRLEELEQKVDRLTMSIVGGAVMMTVSVIVFALTYLANAPP